MKKPADIDAYISGFPEDVRTKLNKLRETFRKAAPGAAEVISYGIPAYKMNGKDIIYFAAFKNHIGIYPAPRVVEEFKKELVEYKGGKGTVQFPLEKELPLGLISRIVKFKVKENLQKAKDKKK
ncbi:MAG TPA: DUF1801 domain-containing protein [Ignavibacteria bacterium]|nr:hypothetical protein [Bacteroidota bacterium]HRI84235.1 DUF1801 domain-containing protein [Ignavibacteria bacterium]HRJ99049.1 DUF1801 domain-containing protein [Ignavibacteria bacterium]